SWLLPRITPGIIYALLWIWFVDPRVGLFNKLLSMIGVPEHLLPGSWLLEKPYAQLLLVIVNGYVGASFGMIVYTAAIKSIPPDLINAALVDGATDFQVVRRIIIPLLKWPILFVTAWQTLSLLASYEYILMVWGAGGGGGDYAGVARAAGVMVWSLYSYSKAFAEYLYGYAAAISMVLVVIGLALILLYFKIFGFKRLMEPSRVEV
ncbi:MAG TPA: sugar ABC transporter permease, partial [Desulfurococcales archaeon]|nr:sugar ABC transporter permease [Desulfurococcales archaeon]